MQLSETYNQQCDHHCRLTPCPSKIFNEIKIIQRLNPVANQTFSYSEPHLLVFTSLLTPPSLLLPLKVAWFRNTTVENDYGCLLVTFWISTLYIFTHKHLNCSGPSEVSSRRCCYSSCGHQRALQAQESKGLNSN